MAEYQLLDQGCIQNAIKSKPGKQEINTPKQLNNHSTGLKLGDRQGKINNSPISPLAPKADENQGLKTNERCLLIRGNVDTTVNTGQESIDMNNDSRQDEQMANDSQQSFPGHNSQEYAVVPDDHFPFSVNQQSLPSITSDDTNIVPTAATSQLDQNQTKYHDLTCSPSGKEYYEFQTDKTWVPSNVQSQNLPRPENIIVQIEKNFNELKNRQPHEKKGSGKRPRYLENDGPQVEQLIKGLLSVDEKSAKRDRLLEDLKDYQKKFQDAMRKRKAYEPANSTKKHTNKKRENVMQSKKVEVIIQLLSECSQDERQEVNDYLNPPVTTKGNYSNARSNESLSHCNQPVGNGYPKLQPQYQHMNYAGHNYNHGCTDRYNGNQSYHPSQFNGNFSNFGLSQDNFGAQNNYHTNAIIQDTPCSSQSLPFNYASSSGWPVWNNQNMDHQSTSGYKATDPRAFEHIRSNSYFGINESINAGNQAK